MVEKKEERTTFEVGPISEPRMRDIMEGLWQRGGEGWRTLRESLKDLLTGKSWVRTDVPFEIMEINNLTFYWLTGKVYIGMIGQIWALDPEFWEFSLVRDFLIEGDKFSGWPCLVWKDRIYWGCQWIRGVPVGMPPVGDYHSGLVHYDPSMLQPEKVEVIPLGYGNNEFANLWADSNYMYAVTKGNTTPIPTLPEVWRSNNPTNPASWVKRTNIQQAGGYRGTGLSWAFWKGQQILGLGSDYGGMSYGLDYARIAYSTDGWATLGVQEVEKATYDATCLAVVEKDVELHVLTSSGKVFSVTAAIGPATVFTHIGDLPCPPMRVRYDNGPSVDGSYPAGRVPGYWICCANRGAGRPTTGALCYYDNYTKRFYTLFEAPFGISDVNVIGGKILLSTVWENGEAGSAKTSVGTIITLPYSEVGYWIETLKTQASPKYGYFSRTAAHVCTLWNNQAIAGSDVSNGVPCLGFRQKTVYFLANVGGILTIAVQEPDGGWQTYDTVTIVVNTLLSYSITGDSYAIRLSFDTAATVTAWYVFE